MCTFLGIVAIGPALESSRFMKRGLGSLPNLSDLISHSVTITWIIPKIPRDFPKSRNSGRWVKTSHELTKRKSGGSGTAEERMWAILLKTRMRLHGCRWTCKCQQDKPLAGTAELAALCPTRATPGLKFNLWRGEVRHGATCSNSNLLPPLAYPHFLPPLLPPLFHITAKTKTHWQVRKSQTTWAQATPPTGHPAAVAKLRWRFFFSLVANPCGLQDSGGLTPPFARTHRPPHSPAPVSRHASHATAGIVPSCRHPADLVAIPTSPPQHARLGLPPPRHRLHRLHAAIWTPSPNYLDARAAAATIATKYHPPCQQRHHNNDPLMPQPATPHQLAPSPPLPTTTHARNATAASIRPAAPRRHQRRRPDSTRHATHAINATAASTRPAAPTPRASQQRHRRIAINAAAASTPRTSPPTPATPPPHQPDPPPLRLHSNTIALALALIPLNRPGPTSSL
ncbi:hypothetical protein EDB84DRAFT_1623006 [Lactarius hengduanensis]|nr:hypothetical protein EDB84DRAFT_1623006 [Lactarius hengduanensis]